MNRMKQANVVIIGGGFAGVAATRELAGFSGVNVTLIDRNNFHTFQPLLYQVATSGLEPAEVCPTLRSMFGSDPNVTVLLGEMESVDQENRTVRVDGQEFPFDYLLLAIGGRTTYFGNEEWRAMVPGLKGLHDALEVRARLLQSFELAEKEDEPGRREELLTTVVVGGGPTGVELAGAIAELKNCVMREQFKRIDPSSARVILLEARPQLLAGMPDALRRYTKEALEEMGVEVVLETPVTELQERSVSTDDSTYRAENIIWAAGIEGYPLADSLTEHITKKKTVEVRDDLSLRENDRILCAGDMVYLEQDGDPLPGLAPVAKQEGIWAAQNIKRMIRGEQPRPFRYKDMGAMAVIGRKRAVAHLFSKVSLRGPLAWVAWLFVHLMFLMGFRNRAVVLVRWLWSYLSWRNSARVLNSRYLEKDPRRDSA